MNAMSEFVPGGSIVRKIWGDPDLILLIFAGSAAEFALNRAVASTLPGRQVPAVSKFIVNECSAIAVRLIGGLQR